MSKVYESAVIAAPVSDVWKLVGDYANISSWHPVVNESRIEEGPAGDKVGAIRTCTLENGAQLHERQTARSDEDFSFTYIITQSPMPMKNYQGDVRLHPVTGTGETFIEWSADFDPDADAEAELPGMISGMLKAGFEALQSRFAGG